MAASSSTVDLSRLPAPSLVEQLPFDTIYAQLVAAVQVLLPSFSAAVDSDPAVKVLQVAAYREQLLRQAFQDAALQLMLAYASGANLDQLGALLGVARLIVTPADAITGAAAIYETDDALRQRIVLAPEAYTVAGPELAYVARAKAADGSVADASAWSPEPGQVLVSVLAAAGDGTAPADLLATVAAVVTDRAVRPLGDEVTVASAVLVPFQVMAALTTFSGPDVTVVIAAAQAALDAYLAASRLLGRDVTMAGIVAALMVAGVANVALASPAADVVCDLTQVAHVTAIGITHAGFAQ